MTKPNEGTTAATSPLETSFRKGVDVPPPATKTRILIVDDLPEKFLVFEAILEELGQTLVYASSGAEALKLVLRDEFAVILLDVNMPGMDGFEAASLIRSRRRSASTPIIFLTAFADEMRIAQGYASGAVDYIPTPVVPEILRAKVKVFVELFQMRCQAALQAEEHAKKLVAEEAARRFAFLAGAGDSLNRSLDFETTLQTFVEISIPYLADLTVVRVDQEVHPEQITACAWQGAHGPKQFHRKGCGDWMDDALASARPSRHFSNGLPAAVRIETVPVDLDDAPELAGGSLLVLPISARGRDLGMIALARSARRPAFHESDVTLAQDVANRGAAALENALLVQTIRETDRRKDEFLATLAHELRNPLAPVRNAVEILNRLDLQDQRIERCRTIIDRQVKQLTRLVDDLLDVSRINSGKIELRKERVNVATIIDRAVEISRTAIESAGHELSVTLPERPLVLEVDPIRIAQVIANLLNNAAKYTAHGGRIQLIASGDESTASISVVDNGVGIPPGMLSDIFSMFTQVENSLDRAQGGLGVGLSLSKRLVELHGGNVSAHSEGLGLGSEFIIKLPLTTQAPTPMEPAKCADSTTPTAEPLRILVVDDNRDSAVSLGLLLEGAGHVVRVTFDGASAIALAERFKPTVVFLDIGMPEMNGMEVARRLRQDSANRETLLVALTGWGQDDDRRRTAQAGFDFHCVKPLDLDELSNVLDKARNLELAESRETFVK
jgi:signal transduction histidine kinase/DNA-binding response OmpR family regulator